MSINTNTYLLKFFKWWLSEAESEHPDYYVTVYGLCYNIQNNPAAPALVSLLHCNYGDSVFPFGGESQWDYDKKYDTMHLNPERVAFVKSQIERLEKLNETI